MRASAAHGDPAALVVLDGDVPAQHLRAIAHELHSHAIAGISLVKTPPVVLHAEGQGAVGGRQVDGRPA